MTRTRSTFPLWPLGFPPLVAGLPLYTLVEQWRRYVAAQNQRYAAQAAREGWPFVPVSALEVEFAAQLLAAAGLQPPDDDL
jgi:hypothetical protein